MIIDITMTNFRSIREKQTFSLLAESASTKQEENIVPVEDKIHILRSAGIYGANASGKSNLLLAFWALRYMVCGSGDLEDGDHIPCYEPYRLNQASKAAPVDFEIEFFCLYQKNMTRFIYAISFDAHHIISESLDFYPSQAKANLFKRHENDGWENVRFGTFYKGGKRKHAFFPNNSYLSKAGNSADAPEFIRSIYNYFKKNIVHLGRDENFSLLDWRDNPEMVASVASILCKVDTGISDIQFRDIDTSNVHIPEIFAEPLKQKILAYESKKPFFQHQGNNGEEEMFSENIESDGTKRLFKTLPLLLKIFEEGSVLIMDELESSLHPHVAELIIKLFNNPDVNQNNAQLIFSTHNLQLMSPALLRRDQIWLTEKRYGETLFSSLDDFDKKAVKMDSPFSKWYDEGRFGAIPEIDIAEISRIISARISDAKNSGE